MPTFGTKMVQTGDRFDIDADNSTGLSVHVRGGVYLDGIQGFRSAAGVRLTLVASSRNFVEMDSAGVITANQTGFTDGATQLYLITTNATIVTDVADCRANAGVANASSLS